MAIAEPDDEQQAPGVQDQFDESGVDLTQIDWMLSLTPRERLSALYETAASLARLMNHANAD